MILTVLYPLMHAVSGKPNYRIGPSPYRGARNSGSPPPRPGTLRYGPQKRPSVRHSGPLKHKLLLWPPSLSMI